MGSEQSTIPRARSVPIGEAENPNESPIYINSLRLIENGGAPIATFRSQPDATTTTQLLDKLAAKFKDNDAVGEREVLPDGSSGKYRWISFGDFRQKCVHFAAALHAIGVNKGDKIGIFSHSCIGWQVAHFGSHYAGAVPVTVYDSLGAGSARFIIEHSECKILVIHAQRVDITKDILKDLPHLRVIVISTFAYDNMTPFEEFIETGRQNKDFEIHEPVKTDIAMLMYTSGATGTPKGCILTHENIIAGGTGLGSARFGLTTKDTYCAYLPLAHVYELCSEMTMLAHGVRIGFYSGDSRDLMKDIAELQPTVICGVPRVLTKIVDSIHKIIDEQTPVLRMAIKWAIQSKIESLSHAEPHSLFLDFTLLLPFRQLMGGRVKLIVSGGAPLLPEIYETLRAVITPNIIQGYGATEISSAGCVQEVGACNPMTVGPVSIATDMKFRSVEGMDYDPNGSPPSGELMFRGPGTFQGYYKDDPETSEVICDGWYASGDVGFLTSEGEIHIIDRVKQFVKLSHGEYISLSKLADDYSDANSVRHIYVFADSHHNQPVAVVVPTEATIEDWKARGIINWEQSEIAKNEVLKELKERCEEAKLRGFERILDIILESHDFSEDNGLLTPSQKLHIQALRSKYESRLLDLYNLHDSEDRY